MLRILNIVASLELKKIFCIKYCLYFNIKSIENQQR